MHFKDGKYIFFMHNNNSNATVCAENNLHIYFCVIVFLRMMFFTKRHTVCSVCMENFLHVHINVGGTAPVHMDVLGLRMCTCVYSDVAFLLLHVYFTKPS